MIFQGWILSFSLLVGGHVANARSSNCEKLLARPQMAAIVSRRYVNPDDLVHATLPKDLYQIQNSTPATSVEIWNESLIRALLNQPVPADKDNRVGGLTEGELGTLFWKVRNHPLAGQGLVHHRKYDPRRNFGFCFGRAFIAHIEALKSGLRKESIRKIWVVGEMDAGGRTWQHHVATMVRGVDGEWYVLDPLSRELKSLPEWKDFVFSHFPGPKLQLFATLPSRFSPTDERPLRPSTVRDPIFNRYFEDLVQFYRQEARNQIAVRQGLPACAADTYSTWRCVKDVLGLD